MPATQLVSSQDGPRLTVAQLVSSPTLIPRRMLDMLDQQFLCDVVLRGAADAPSGSIMFFESTPLFAKDDPAILDEFGEIPTTNGSIGTPKVARVVRRALGVRVSKTMLDRNDIDAVNIQLTQIKNTMVRAWEDAFFSAVVANTVVQSVTTAASWGAASNVSHIRQDLSAAKYLVKVAAADTAKKQKYGYVADTLIISIETEEDLTNSDEMNNVFVGNIADKGIKYKGVLPREIAGLDVFVSWRLSAYFPNGAIVCQRKVLGGISDERPLQATPLYGEGGGPNGGPRESWRSDLTRASAIFLDQPRAVVLITGVNGGSTAYPTGVTVVQ